MNFLTLPVIFFAAAISINASAAVTYIDVNKAIEGASIEILHNPENNSGTVIVRDLECKTCKPLSLSYKEMFSFSIEGIKQNYTADSPRMGLGDIIYTPETLTVDHVNFYQRQ